MGIAETLFSQWILPGKEESYCGAFFTNYPLGNFCKDMLWVEEEGTAEVC